MDKLHHGRILQKALEIAEKPGVSDEEMRRAYLLVSIAAETRMWFQNYTHNDTNENS